MADTIACHSLNYCLLLFDAVYIGYVGLDDFFYFS